MPFSSFDSYFIIYFLVISGIFGAVMGSAVTCQADRLSAHESWLKGRSHCDACGHELGILDLIPVFSYLIHKGKCRYCGTKLSKKYLITELLMAAGFVLIAMHYNCFTVLIIRDWGLMCALLGLSVVDMESYEIPDRYIVFGIVWRLLFLFAEEDRVSALKNGVLTGLAVAGSLLVISLIMDHILKKESMGGGDIKLFFMTGLYMNLFMGLFNVIIACLCGLSFMVILKKEKIPFGPSISIATVVTLLIGTQFVQWYLGLL
jgi:leader peptidase (prepilin peptidase)/N-methyltransferase